MPADAEALGQRIRELRGATPRAKIARQAAIAPAYLHAVETATPSTRTGVPTIPSVPVLRAIADALDGDRAELLELAGYDDDAAMDRARAAKRARVAHGLDISDLSEEDQAYIQGLVDRLRGDA